MASAQQPLSPEVHHIPLKPPPQDEALALPPPPSLGLQRAPEVVLEEARRAARALQDVIESKPNKCVINGKTFLTLEDWLTVARFFSITVACRSTSYLEQGRSRGYEAHAEAIFVPSGQVIGAAQAMCMDDEQKWHDKPLFQLRSMAQTRAMAKALRSILAFVPVLAGYSPTPAEEMDGKVVERAIAPRMEYTPMHPDKVRNLCFGIANAANIESLRSRYLAANAEAKKANDRAALDAFMAAKDQRKKELQ